MRRVGAGRGMRRAATAWLVAGALALPLGAAAQWVPGAAAPPGGGVGVTYERYSFGNAEGIGVRSVSLLSVPVTARASLAGGLEAGLSSAYAFGHLERADGSTASLGGLTDTQLSLAYETPGGGVRVTAIGILPTGHERQDADQAEVAGIVAADVLPFAITNWGTGGGGGGSVAVAQSIGATNVGASVGYVVAARFRPLTGSTFYYRPGDQLHVRAALDRTFGTAGKLSLQLSYQHFATDQFAATNLYRSGDRLLGMGSYAFAVGARSSALLYGGLLHRQHGTFLGGGGVEAAQNLALAGGALRVPLGGAVLQPRADVRALSQAGEPGTGYVVGAGASVELNAGAATVVPLVMGRFGHANVFAGETSAITGLELGLGLRFGGRR